MQLERKRVCARISASWSGQHLEFTKIREQRKTRWEGFSRVPPAWRLRPESRNRSWCGIFRAHDFGAFPGSGSYCFSGKTGKAAGLTEEDSSRDLIESKEISGAGTLRA